MAPLIAFVAAVVPIGAALRGLGHRRFYFALMLVGGLAGACSVKMTPSADQFAAIVESGDEGEIMDAALFRDHGQTAAAGGFGMSAGGLMGAVLFRSQQPILETSQAPAARRWRRPGTDFSSSGSTRRGPGRLEVAIDVLILTALLLMAWWMQR